MNNLCFGSYGRDMFHVQLGAVEKLQFKMDDFSRELSMYRTRNLKGISITKENSIS